MGCRILLDADEDLACLYDSVTMTAFGRVFSGPSAGDQAQAFLNWHDDNYGGADPRTVDVGELGARQDAWLARFASVKDPEFECAVCDAEAWHLCDEDEPKHARVGG